MQHHTMRTFAAGAGAAALMGIVLAGPALANSPTLRGTDDSGATITQAPPSQHGGPGSSAVPQQGPPSYNSWPSVRSDGSGGGATARGGSGFDLAPLAWSALGGASVAGAAALVAGSAIGRRRAVHA